MAWSEPCPKPGTWTPRARTSMLLTIWQKVRGARWGIQSVMYNDLEAINKYEFQSPKKYFFFMYTSWSGWQGTGSRAANSVGKPTDSTLDSTGMFLTKFKHHFIEMDNYMILTWWYSTTIYVSIMYLLTLSWYRSAQTKQHGNIEEPLSKRRRASKLQWKMIWGPEHVQALLQSTSHWVHWRRSRPPKGTMERSRLKEMVYPHSSVPCSASRLLLQNQEHLAMHCSVPAMVEAHGAI